jgi:hypothetical protein
VLEILARGIEHHSYERDVGERWPETLQLSAEEPRIEWRRSDNAAGRRTSGHIRMIVRITSQDEFRLGLALKEFEHARSLVGEDVHRLLVKTIPGLVPKIGKRGLTRVGNSRVSGVMVTWNPGDAVRKCRGLPKRTRPSR